LFVRGIGIGFEDNFPFTVWFKFGVSFYAYSPNPLFCKWKMENSKWEMIFASSWAWLSAQSTPTALSGHNF
jgi:hypothetical protein